jgi:hypothetical protein
MIDFGKDGQRVVQNSEVGRFQAVLGSLGEFDNAEVHPIVEALLSPTEREKCFIVGYYRAVASVRSLLMFQDASHFQAIAMLARALFELAVDLRFIDVEADAIAKLYAYCASERLRVARDTVALAIARKTADDVSIQEGFIAARAASIDAQHLVFWPNTKKIIHWSGKNLRNRTEQLGSPYEEAYVLSYAQLSWDVHPGLAGVLDLDVNAFPAKCGLAFQFAFEWYADVLRSVAAELKIDKAVEKLKDKIQLATMLPFARTPEEAARLREVILG